MDKIWLNLSVKLVKPSANKICGSSSFKFNQISPILASFRTQILRLKFKEIYTQILRKFSKFFLLKKCVNFRLKNLRRFFENKSANLMQKFSRFLVDFIIKFANFRTQIWRKFINKISVNLPLNLSPILNLKSRNLQFNLTKFCVLGFKNFSHKDKFHTKFRAKI